MTQRLAVVDGPLAGTAIPLSEADLCIGREEAIEVTLEDRLVSRRHASVVFRDGRYVLRDLDSHNGSFVNGLPVRERALEHGDRITIGSSILVYLDRDDDSVESIERTDSEVATKITDVALRLRADDTLYLRPDRLPIVLPDAVKLAHGFQTLLGISTAIASIRDVPSLANRLLELLFDAIPADHGAILLIAKTTYDAVAAFGRQRGVGACDAPGVSRTIVRIIVDTGEALLSNDALNGEPLGEVESVRVSGIGSLLVVPIARGERPLGIIYLSTAGTKGSFNEGHLQLLAAVAQVAAPVFETARHVEILEREKRLLADELALRHNMVGDGPRMRSVFDFVARVAAHDSTVLILGESGTGKELVARAIHQSSPRSRRSFVAVNCATLTDHLLESELFGHERGAFTGAIAQRRGKLELADGGTIFLDEIGELAPQLQAKLLRALQEREVERIGGSRPIPLDIRVIAATNREIEADVASGVFRRDLFYRLNVVCLTVPPLRERREDIPLLAGYFTTMFADRCKRRVLGVSHEARALLMAYDWPGNVRELENTIERAVVLGATDRIEPEDLPETVRRVGALVISNDEADRIEDSSGTVSDVIRSARKADTGFHEAIAEFRVKLVRDALERTGGNVSEAARLLGVHRNYVARLAKG
jgi:transcriptional regulator with GAF, ATPase, and Fis domain